MESCPTRESRNERAGTMRKLRVKINPATRSSLKPWYDYDTESNVLVVGGYNTRPSYSLNVDGGILTLDLDAERTLVNFDLAYPRSSWPVGEFPEDPMRGETRGDLTFSRRTVEHLDLHLPVNVLTNRGRTRLLIEIGGRRIVSNRILLSDACLALVDHDCLCGFVLRLE